jgi:hypothetical protein
MVLRSDGQLSLHTGLTLGHSPPVVHCPRSDLKPVACHPSYLGDRDQDAHGSRLALSKVKTPSQQKKLGMVEYFCSLSYAGDGSRTVVQGWPEAE